MAKFRHTWSHYSRPKFLRISCQDDADTESARTADEQIDYLEGLEPCPCYAKCCLDSIITLFCVTLLGWNSSPIASLYRHTNVTCQIWAALQTTNYRLFLNWSSGVCSIFYPRHSFHSLSHTHTPPHTSKRCILDAAIVYLWNYNSTAVTTYFNVSPDVSITTVDLCFKCIKAEKNYLTNTRRRCVIST